MLTMLCDVFTFIGQLLLSAVYLGGMPLIALWAAFRIIDSEDQGIKKHKE